MAESRAVRVFVALELPDAFRREAGRLASAVAALGIRGARPVRTEGAHLTLKFLGDVESARVADAMDAMRIAAARSAPFVLRSGDFGAFPNADAPRVLWLGVDGDLAALQNLRDGLEDSMSASGFPRDRRRFAPHVTAVRVGDRVSAGDRKRLVETARAVRLSTVEFAVERVSLMRSDRRPDGAVYVRLGDAALG